MNSTEKDKRVRTIGILAALGFFISIYLTKDHYAAGTSICDTGGLLSCSVVNRSSFSELLGNYNIFTLRVVLNVYLRSSCIYIWYNLVCSVGFWIMENVAK